MYVVYHSSNSFVEVTGVSITSLFENNKNLDNIHILYIEKDISEENKSKLYSLADKYNRTIEFMAMPDWSNKLNICLKTSKSNWLGFGYNRLFLCEYIPETVDKVLYLDSDTVIEQSLQELWNINIDDYYMAGVDDCLSRYYYKLVDTKEVYCNAGMLILNLKKWREDSITDQFIKKIYEKKGYFIFNDQSILNEVLGTKTYILPQKYNVNSLVYLFEYDELIKLRNPANFSYSKEEFYNARLNPVITHYTGNFYVKRRPWINDSDHPHKEAYLIYKNKSPWKNTELQKSEIKGIYKFYANLCSILPRKIMILFVSILYNRIRPIMLQKKMEKARK